MSEYTAIYLRKKGEPLLKYRHISWEDTVEMTKEEVVALHDEVHEYNRKVDAELGCELFCLNTTPSRQLEVLPYSEDPRLLTTDMLAEILGFYDEEIEERRQFIKMDEEELIVLENRIRMADVKLYDKISQEIFEIKNGLPENRETMEELRSLRGRFEFVANMMQGKDNAEKYELVYTKS
ncbi:MAG: hypothetical protein MJY73_07770 [Bacteroidales bacterium]|nr:hypothetical protein [Bacteroidales bacterium]